MWWFRIENKRIQSAEAIGSKAKQAMPIRWIAVELCDVERIKACAYAPCENLWDLYLALTVVSRPLIERKSSESEDAYGKAVECSYRYRWMFGSLSITQGRHALIRTYKSVRGEWCYTHAFQIFQCLISIDIQRHLSLTEQIWCKFTHVAIRRRRNWGFMLFSIWVWENASIKSKDREGY